MILAGRIDSPPEVSTHSPLPPRATLVTPVPPRIRIPYDRNDSVSRPETSASRKGRSRVPRSTSVTSAPRARKIEAYSQATAPPPTTTRLSSGRSNRGQFRSPGRRGLRRECRRMERARSGGGFRTASASRTCDVPPSPGSTTTVRPGPRHATPVMRSMSWRRRFSRTASLIIAATRAARERSRSIAACGSRSRLTP